MEQCCEARPFYLAPPSTRSRYQACGGYCNRVLLCGAAIFCCLLLLLFCFPCCLLGSHHCIHLLDGFRPLLLHMLNMHRPRLGGCTLSHTLAQIALPKSSSDPITVLSHTTTNWILKKFLDTHTLKSPRVGCIYIRCVGRPAPNGILIGKDLLEEYTRYTVCTTAMYIIIVPCWLDHFHEMAV